MKAVFLTLLLVLPLGARAADVRPGATFAEVNATMGAPLGQVRLGDRQLLYYDRGEIELQAGAVSRVALLSPDAYAALEVRRTAAAARIQQEQAIRRAQRSAKGEKLMTRKLADPLFRATPLSYQMAFWEDFSRRFPEVSCAEQLMSTRLLYAQQLETNRIRVEQAQQAERVAELEARLAEAEARVHRVPFFATYVGNFRQRFANRRTEFDCQPARRGAEQLRDTWSAIGGFAPALPRLPLAPIGGNARDTSSIGESQTNPPNGFSARFRM